MKLKTKVKVVKRWGVWDSDCKMLLYVMRRSEQAAQCEIEKFKVLTSKCVPIRIEIRYTVPRQKEKP